MLKKKQVKKSEIFWVSGGVLVLTIMLFWVLQKDEKIIPHRNPIDAQISQYSDKNITPNAIVINQEFKNIVFETNIPKSSFLHNQIATAIRAFKSFTYQSKKEEAKEYGSWIWTPIMQMTPEYIETTLSLAKASGVNTIYVSVDSYLDIFVMPKGKEREKQKEIFSNKLEYFINSANKKGIMVDAEAGWRNWAEDDNIYKAFAIINYVKDFNNNHKNKFRGFQYDVEPYLLEKYKKEKAEVLGNFVQLVDQTEKFLSESDLRFSVVIPDFFDEKDKMTPSFSYNNKKDFVIKHLLNILDRRKNSSIIIMSYRNFAEGEDGAIEVSNNEMQTAKKYNTKIIIAQETGDVPPPYITFHNMSKRHFSNQVNKINTAFNSYSNFGGISIHYVNAFLALK